MKKLSILFVAAILAFTLSDCSTSDPAPTPAQKTALDSVKAVMTGTWKFSSVAVMEISTGKSAATSTCSRDELKVKGLFTNTNWLQLTPEFNFIFNQDGSATMTNACIAASSSAKVTAVKNSDDTVTITIDGGGTAVQVYKLTSKNTSASSVKASLISDGNFVSATAGYNVVMTFTR